MWILAERSELPGIWTAQAMEVDACGSGPTIEAAVQSALDIVALLRQGYGENGRTPKAAPPEVRAGLETVRREGKRVDPDAACREPDVHVPKALALYIPDATVSSAAATTAIELAVA